MKITNNKIAVMILDLIVLIACLVFFLYIKSKDLKDLEAKTMDLNGIFLAVVGSIYPCFYQLINKFSNKKNKIKIDFENNVIKLAVFAFVLSFSTYFSSRYHDGIGDMFFVNYSFFFFLRAGAIVLVFYILKFILIYLKERGIKQLQNILSWILKWLKENIPPMP